MTVRTVDRADVQLGRASGSMASGQKPVNSGPNMPTEIELKLRIADHQAARTRLVAVGAHPVADVLETNWILDTTDRRLRAADTGLRVRQAVPADANATPAATLTFKGPRTGDTFKSREEQETLIDDPAAVLRILKRLGFMPTIVFEKRRATFKLGPCHVTLDELPRLGWFTEIEGASADDVEQARAKLAIDDAEPVAETYVELAAQHGDQTAAGVRQLMFD